MTGIAWQSLRHAIDEIDLRSIRRLAADYRAFPLFGLPSALINSLALLLPIPYIAHLYGADAAGLYSLASNMVFAPFIFVGGSVADAFHGRIARYARENPNRALPFMLQVAGLLALIGAGPIVLLALAGDPLFGTIFGGQWSEAGRLAAAITPWALTQFIVSPLSRAVLVFGGQEQKLIYDGLSLVTVIGVFLLAQASTMSLTSAVLLLSLSQALTYAVYLVILIRVVRQDAG